MSIKEKILIACQVIAGEKIQPVAKKHGVSRPSIHTAEEKRKIILFNAHPGTGFLSLKEFPD